MAVRRKGHNDYIEIIGYLDIGNVYMGDLNWSLKDVSEEYENEVDKPFEIFLHSSRYIRIYKCKPYFFKRMINIQMKDFEPILGYKQNEEKFNNLKGYILNIQGRGVLKDFTNEIVGDINVVKKSKGLDYGTKRKLMNEVDDYRAAIFSELHNKNKKDNYTHRSTTKSVSNEDYNEGIKKKIKEAGVKNERYMYYNVKNKVPSKARAVLDEEKSKQDILKYNYRYPNEEKGLDSDFSRGPHKDYQTELLTMANMGSMLVLDNTLHSESLRTTKNLRIYIDKEKCDAKTLNTYYAPDGKGLIYDYNKDVFGINLLEFKVSYISTRTEEGLTEQLRRESEWLEQINNNLGIYYPEKYYEYVIYNKIHFDSYVDLTMIKRRTENSIYKDIEIFTKYALEDRNAFVRDLVDINYLQQEDYYKILDVEIRRMLIKDFFNNLNIHYTFIVNNECNLTKDFVIKAKQISEYYGCVIHIYKIDKYYNYIRSKNIVEDGCNIIDITDDI